MDPTTWLMIAQTAGKLFGDANNEKTTKEMRAAELRAMPWTGRGPSTSAQFANPWATLGTATTAYAMQDAGAKQAEADSAFRDKLLDRMMPQAAPAAAPAPAAAAVTPNMDLRNARQALGSELGYDPVAPMSTMPEMQPWERSFEKATMPPQAAAPLVTPGADLRKARGALIQEMGTDPFAPKSSIPQVAPWDESLIKEQMNPWIPRYQPSPWQGLYVPPTVG